MDITSSQKSSKEDISEELKICSIYLPIVDGVFIFDNSEVKHELLADKQFGTSLNIVNIDKFNLLKSY